MAKKSRRSVSRKMKRTAKRKDRRTKRARRHGGAYALDGAPVSYHLAGSWPSRMSLGQGADYFKYHVGQHGGALDMGPYPGAVLDRGLPAALRGPAMIGGIDKAIQDVSGLRDATPGPGTAVTTGGKRHKKHKKGKSKSHKKGKKSARKGKGKSLKKARKTKRNKKSKGGSLGYAPFPSSGMLLNSSQAYARAGLNPEWKTDVAYDLAKIRESQ
jgi:hypothetical protein